MNILLNNRSEQFAGESISVNDMLVQKKFTYKMRIIKINGILISKDKYNTTLIHDGDDVQMLYLMSGG